VALSTDDCRTWSPPRTVTEPSLGPDGALSYATACYPSLAEAADGTMLLAWWQRDNQSRNSVWVARFNREWIEEARQEPPRRRIVAVGDSVTLGVRPGVSEYQTFRHRLEAELGAGGIPTRIVNAGVPGDTTAGGLRRLGAEVLTQAPELVIVMFGVNDAAMVDGGPIARSEPRVPLATYAANLHAIITQVRAAGAKVLLCTPTPMSRRYVYQNLGAYAQHEDINFMLRRYAAAVRQVAVDTDTPVVDCFELFAATPEGLDLIEDGNHPYAKGHARLAAALLLPVQRLLR
jgi:acyl-CoA thioesterase-1